MKKHGFLWLVPVMLLTGLLLGCPSGGEDILSNSGGRKIGGDGKGEENGVKFSPLTASLGKGVSQQFDAVVTGNPTDTVIWSLEGNLDPATKLEGTGRQRELLIGADETAKTIRIIGVAKSNSKATGDALVYIIDNGNFPIESGLAVSPGRISVNKGSRQQFMATVSATGGTIGSVTWTVEGSISTKREKGAATSITDGVLTVGTTEAAVTLTVRAEYGGLYGTAVVYIKDNGGVPSEDGALYPSNLGLSVSPAELTLDKGETSQPFTATNSGGNDVTGAVKSWSLRNAVSSSIINKSSVSVGSAETMEYIWLKAAGEGGEGEAVIHVRGNETEPVVINNGVQIQPQPATVAPGGQKVFTATDSINGGTPAVTWRVYGGKSGTIVNPGGQLTVANNETAAWLTLRAEMSGGRYGTAAVKVGDEEVFINIPGPVGFGITVNPLAITLVKNSEKQFTALDDGGNEAAVNWSLENADGKSADTGIDGGGKLSIAADEGLPWITVKATDKDDVSSYGTALVYLSDTAEESHPLTSRGITVSPGTWELTPGGTKLFTAKLTGTEDDVSVTWALDPSDRKAGTTINENGNLSIDQSEAVDTVLVVRATGNDGKYGTAQVTMKAAPAVVSGVTIKVGGSSPSAITLERGETETFTAEVTGDNLGDAGQKVSWDIVETGKSDSTTISNGVLSIAADEGLSGLAVKATSTTDTSKSATVTVNIPTVSISLSPTSVGVQKGSTQTFTATVTALHGADSGVTWSIVGSHTASSLSSTGDSRTLTVGGNESLDSLTVRVTSTFTKPQVHADAAVTLSDAPPSVSGVTITTPSDNPLYIKRGTANTQFSASVQGNNSPSQTVTWSVSGNSQGGGTSIGTNDGKLSIGQAETAESLTVRATAAGTSIYGEKTVLIPTVKSVSITTAPSKVARGDAAGSTVAASVTVANNETSLLSTDVKWIVTNAKKPETKIAGGKLYVDKDETATPLTIEATASANSSKYATASVPVSSVTGVTVSPVVTVSRGSNATLSAEVAGVNNPSRTVTWAITSVGHASGTSIDSSGKLTVASDEAKSSITVKATSAEDNRVSGTVTVQIPTVTNVTITPSTAEVAKGGSTTFSATVAASGGAVETVTWSVVTTGVNENTKFPNPTSSGLFQVASDETVASITIRATSTADGSKSGTATVSVPQPTVISVELSPGRVKVIAGKTQQFGATVTGTNSPPQTVIWSIEGNNLDGISISEGGNLFVAHFGTAETFTVRATSTFDTSKSGEVAVTVLVPTVSGVELIPSGNVFVPPNVTQQFSATVTGTNDPDQTVNWSIEGPHHTGTHINDSGYLIVDIDETAASFKVRATHTFDLSKYGEATVNTRPIAVDH